MSVQPTPVRSPANPDRLFEATVFLAAFLLFLVEPIAAKQLLPAFGGSAAVWITCLVFFQAALLAGYTYAHRLSQSKTFHDTSTPPCSPSRFSRQSPGASRPPTPPLSPPTPPPPFSSA